MSCVTDRPSDVNLRTGLRQIPMGGRSLDQLGLQLLAAHIAITYAVTVDIQVSKVSNSCLPRNPMNPREFGVRRRTQGSRV